MCKETVLYGEQACDGSLTVWAEAVVQKMYHGFCFA